jgi:hypothetical protein
LTKALVIATAGLKPSQLEDDQHLLFPRVDYLVLNKYVDIDVINWTLANLNLKS